MLKALRRFADARTVEGRIVTAILVVTLALMAWDVNALRYALADEDAVVAAQSDDAALQAQQEREAAEKAQAEAAAKEAAEKAEREAAEKAAAEKAKAEKEAAEKAAAEKAKAEKEAAEKAAAEKAAAEKEAAEKAAAAKEAEKKAAEEKAAKESQKASAKDSAETASPATKESTDDAQESPQQDTARFPAAILLGKVGDITVQVEAPEGALAEGAQLRVYPVPATQEEARDDKNAAKLHLPGISVEDLAQRVQEETGKTYAECLAIDVSLVDKDSNEVQPRKKVNITFFDTDFESSKVAVYRVDDKKVSKVKTLQADDKSQSFDTKDPYTYFVAAAAKKVESAKPAEDASQAASTEDAGSKAAEAEDAQPEGGNQQPAEAPSPSSATPADDAASTEAPSTSSSTASQSSGPAANAPSGSSAAAQQKPAPAGKPSTQDATDSGSKGQDSGASKDASDEPAATDPDSTAGNAESNEEPSPQQQETPAEPAQASIQVNYLDMDGNPLPDAKSQKLEVKVGAAYTVSVDRVGYTLNRVELDGADQGRRVKYVAQDGAPAIIDVYYQVNLTVAAKDKSKEYDGRALLSAGLEDAEVTGLIEGHALASVSFDGYQKYVGSSATTPKNAEVSGPQSSDYYLVTYQAGTLTVTAPAPAAASDASPAEEAAPPVDPSLPALSLSAVSGGGVYSGQPYRLGDVRSSVPDAVIQYKVGNGAWSTKEPEVKDVLDSMDGTISVRATREGYNYAQVDGLSIVVTPRAATITAKDATKTYGDVDPLFKAEVSGLVNDEPPNVVSYSFDRVPGEDVGTYEITMQGSAQQGNYEVSFRPAKLEITPAQATVVPLDASKVYGQDDPEAFAATVSGLKLSDTDDVVSYTVSRSQGEEAGSYELTARGENSQGNYQVQFASGTFTIQKAPVRVVAQDARKAFSTPDPTFGVQVTGLEDGGQVDYTVSREPGENVGSYAIKVEGPAEQGNYSVEFVPGTFHIDRVKATVVATAATKQYGEPDPAYSITVKGLPEGISSQDISYTAAREPGEDVGTYALAVEGAKIQGNFELSFEPGTLTIEPAPVTVAVDDAVKTYGDVDPAFDATVKGLKNGETARSAGISFTLSRASGEAAGEYAITATGAARQGNYELAYEPGTLTIGRAPAVVTPLNSGKAAGQDDPELAAIVSGLKGTDTADAITYELNRAEGEGVGTYAIEATGEAEQGNYDVSFGTADFAVVEAGKLVVFTTSLEAGYTGAALAAPAVPSIVAGTKLEYSVDGGQTWSADVPTRADAGTTTVQVRATNPDAGTASAEYSLSIAHKQVQVRADDAQKVYGEADPVFVYRVNGLVDGDRATLVRVSDVAREAGEDVGTYAIEPTGKEEQGNYQVVFQAGSFTINPRAVTVRGDDASKVYGQVDPQLSATVEGVLDDETEDAISFEVKRSDEANQNVGVYAVMPLGNAMQGNYAVTYIAGSFTIEPAQATVTADGIQKVYGQEDPELTATVDGLVDDDAPVYTIARQPGEEPGSYGIEVTGEANQGNYRVEFAGNTFVIEEAQDAAEDAAPVEPADEPAPAQAEPAAKQVFTDEFEDADGNVTTVTVEAPAGTFPEGTTMAATPVQAEDVRDRVEAAIEDPEVRGAITKMVAVDITFFDAEGNEIEPADNVAVRISSDTVDGMRDPLLVHVPDAG